MTAPARPRRTFGLGPRSFYDGSPGRRVVACPDCGLPADESLGGDHAGFCIASVRVASPKSALGIIRAHALKHEKVGINQLRQAFIAAGVRKSSRAPALTAARKNGWIADDGFEPSTDPATKKHSVKVYRSLIVGQGTKKDTR